MCSTTGLVLNFFILAACVWVAQCSGSSRQFNTCTPTQWELENSPLFAAKGIIPGLYETFNINQTTNGLIIQAFVSHIRCYWDDDGGLWKRCDEICQHVSKIRECQSRCPVMHKCLYGAAEDGFKEICSGTMSPVFLEFAPPATPSPPVCAHPVDCKHIEANSSQHEVTNKTLHSLDSLHIKLIALAAVLGLLTIVLVIAMIVMTAILCRRMSCCRHSPENEVNEEPEAEQQDHLLTEVDTADSAFGSSRPSTASVQVTE